MNLQTEHHIATPALVIDPRIVERNLSRMGEYCRWHGLELRPHAKTHKSVRMGRRQVEHGAIGLTVAKAGEAEAMAQASSDILVAYPVIDPARAARLAQLARAVTVRVALDSPHAADAIDHAAQREAATIGILIDLDVGYHRTGVPSPQAALALARHVATKPHLRYDGLFCYPGHVLPSVAGNAEAISQVAAKLDEAIELLCRAGLTPAIVSGGSTPTATISHLLGHYTEIRPGTYIYNDWNTASGGYCTEADCAARVLCTVISDAVPGKVVIDAGSKTLSSDRLVSDPQHGGFGHVVDFDGARVTRLSEEHGEIDVSACPIRPKLAQRIWIIPNHICPCVNLQDVAWLRSADDRLEPLPIDARGKLV